MKTLFISIPATLLLAGTAMAQDAPAEPMPAEPPVEAEAPAAPAASTDVTPDEVDAFAVAALQLETIAAQPDLDDTQKQTAMVAAVQEAGLAPERFNEIGQAAQADPALQEQVQLAVSRQLEAAPAPQ